MSDYCSLADLKSVLNITDAVDDQQLSAVISAASGWIDSYCNRNFPVASGTTTRDYIPSGRFEVLPIDDATSIVQVSIDDDLDGTYATVLPTDEWQAEPLNTVSFGLSMPYNRIRPIDGGYWPVSIYRGQASVRVQATFGWAAVPDAVHRAALLQAARLFTRNDSPLGVAGFGDMGVMRVSRFIDPDVEALLNPYRRMVY